MKSCEAKSPTQSHVSSRYWLTAWLLNCLGLSFGSSHHSALVFVSCRVFYSFSCNLLCLSLHKVWRCRVRGLFHGNSPLLTWALQMLIMLEPALKPSVCVCESETRIWQCCTMWKSCFGPSFYSRFMVTLPTGEAFIAQPRQKLKSKSRNHLKSLQLG